MMHRKEIAKIEKDKKSKTFIGRMSSTASGPRRIRAPLRGSELGELGCFSARERVDHLPKSKYIQAFVCWTIFSIFGFYHIPADWIPVVAHAVGFAMYLLITTQRSRMLIPLAAAMIIYVVLVQ
jgi:hypothetical protein